MIINGNEEKLQKEITLKAYLEETGYDITRIAVEKNGVIVTRDDYDSEILSDGDKIEIVHFVGGG